jgi:hypothetical protein
LLVIERLTDAVDLVVGPSMRKGQQLGLKLRQETRAFREKYPAGFKFLFLNIEPPGLVALYGDWFDSTTDDCSELLRERNPS